jgi:PHP family Zn ribbon phosphoesterase
MTTEPKEQKDDPKQFLGILFKCCNLYSRIYKNRDGKAYEGRCPRCGRHIVVPIGNKGTAHRFFEAC